MARNTDFHRYTYELQLVLNHAYRRRVYESHRSANILLYYSKLGTELLSVYGKI